MPAWKEIEENIKTYRMKGKEGNRKENTSRTLRKFQLFIISHDNVNRKKNKRIEYVRNSW
jgi:hypothetical protein